MEQLSVVRTMIQREEVAVGDSDRAVVEAAESVVANLYEREIEAWKQS
jgi:hypothetical protein